MITASDRRGPLVARQRLLSALAAALCVFVGASGPVTAQGNGGLTDNTTSDGFDGGEPGFAPILSGGFRYSSEGGLGLLVEAGYWATGGALRTEFSFTMESLP